MAIQTLIDLVQDILADADGDNVNSISDTVESDQCARIIRDTYRHIVDVYDLEYIEKLVKLDATSSSTPTVMTRPAEVHSIEWVKYDIRSTAGGDPDFKDIDYVEPKKFMDRQSQLQSSASSVTTQTLSDSGHVLPILNDRAPSCYTFLEGYNNFIFDAYDSNLETNLQQSKSLAYVSEKPTLTLADATQIDLPEHLVSLLRNEARAFYFDVYKEGATPMVDRRRRESNVRAQRQNHLMERRAAARTGPNYGRK